MRVPSLKRCPVAPVFSTRSDPAKSTRVSFPTHTRGFAAPSTLVAVSTTTWNAQCERDETAFMFVDAVER